MAYHPLQDPESLPRTIYTASAPPGPATPPLEGERRADVAIVGAGITGLSAALHAAERRAEVVVLEAREVAWGASGRAFGQVVPYLKHGPDHALRALGPDFGQRMVAAAGEAPDIVFGLVAKHRMDCEPVRTGLIFAAHAPAALGGLERRSRFWQERGVKVEMLDAAATAELIGGGRYWGSALEPRGGTVNCLAYTRGLAQAAIAAGARIHGATRVTALTRRGAQWHLATPAGGVTADTVLLCTNAYGDGLWPGLAQSVVPIRSYGVMSRPLGDNLRRSILPGGQSLTDTRRLLSGIRLHGDGRLHVSIDAPRFGPEATPDLTKADRRVRELFPQLGHVAWEGHWSGWIAMTPDQYPRLHELAPGLLAGLGYSGRGIALGTVMGRELACRALGALPTDLLFRAAPLRRLAVPALARLAVGSVIGLKRVQDAIDLARHARGPQG